MRHRSLGEKQDRTGTERPEVQPRPPTTPDEAVLSLQRGAGNGVVARSLGATLARQVDPARDAFVSGAEMPGPDGLDFQSATGGGGFNVLYDPATQQLKITLRVGIDFLPALEMTPRGSARALTKDFRGAASRINRNIPDPAAREQEVTTNWRWSWQELKQWARDYAAMVQDAWGDQHYFVSNRWPDVYAGVSVDVDVHRRHHDGDHCKATVFKVPPGSTAGPDAGVASHEGEATGSTATFTSAHLGANHEWLNFSLEFPQGSDNLYASISTSKEASGDPGDVHLDKLIVDQQPGAPGGGAPVLVTGRASTSGDAGANRRLSQRRADAVAGYLTSAGATIDAARITVDAKGEEGAGADPSWQRVDIQVGGGEEQVKALHETGHMFGLGDEYSSPAGGMQPDPDAPVIGEQPSHGALPDMGGSTEPAVVENNDNIMSLGNVVRSQHYATFLEALNAVSTEPFSYGGEGPPPAFSVDPPDTGVIDEEPISLP